MKVSISRVHFPVTSLGPGTRVGIWFQGCSIGCPGCISQDTWEATENHQISVDTLVQQCRTWAPRFNGITISGGEPFQQAAALEVMLEKLDRLRTTAHDFDILVYSGFRIGFLKRKYLRVISLCDALIPEPYKLNAETKNAWRGSSNQPIIAISERGRQIYCSDKLDELKSKMQAVTSGGETFMIGVPPRRALNNLEEKLASSGIKPAVVSWRA